MEGSFFFFVLYLASLKERISKKIVPLGFFDVLFVLRASISEKKK